MRQSIRIIRSTDDTMIAWAEAGAGPALVKSSNWLTHLEHDLASPVWQHWTRFFADHFRFIRYDERGCGMSEWNPSELSLQRSREDLAAVIEAAQPEKPFVLLGVSQGGAAAIQYAIDHPDDVSHLVLYGIYVQGRAAQKDPEIRQQYEALIALTRIGWGRNNPVYRQLFTSRFIPGAKDEQIHWFNDLCRLTTTPEMAARIMESRMHIDIRDSLAEVRSPTLVLHAREDEAVSPKQGRLAASLIPGATFIELDSRNHILLEHEPAWERFKQEVLAFTGRPEAAAAKSVFASLSPREHEILARIAEGCTNIEIGRQLFISDKTVRNHVTRIFEKLGVRSRAQAIVLAKDHGLLASPR